MSNLVDQRFTWRYFDQRDSNNPIKQDNERIDSLVENCKAIFSLQRKKASEDGISFERKKSPIVRNFHEEFITMLQYLLWHGLSWNKLVGA